MSIQRRFPVEALKSSEDCRPVHFASFSESLFYVHGVIGLKSALMWKNLEVMVHILRGAEKKNPWRSVGFMPQEQGIEIDNTCVVETHSFDIAIKFHPHEKILRGDQLHAYNRYLARIGEELSTLSVPGLRAIDVSMEIRSVAVTFGSQLWARELGERLERLLPERQ